MTIRPEITIEWHVYKNKLGGNYATGANLFKVIVEYLVESKRSRLFMVWKIPDDKVWGLHDRKRDWKNLQSLRRERCSLIPRGKLVHLLQ